MNRKTNCDVKPWCMEGYVTRATFVPGDVPRNNKFKFVLDLSTEGNPDENNVVKIWPLALDCEKPGREAQEFFDRLGAEETFVKVELLCRQIGPKNYKFIVVHMYPNEPHYKEYAEA